MPSRSTVTQSGPSRARNRAIRDVQAHQRARVARELSEIVVEGLAIVAIQAEAASASLDRSQTQVAASVSVVRAVARESLVEVRRLLRVLEQDLGPAGMAPVPSLDGLRSLVAGRPDATGVESTLLYDGTPRRLEAGIEVCIFRIVEEALTLMLAHGGVGVVVKLQFLAEAVSVSVKACRIWDAAGDARRLSNDALGAAAVAALRERARVFGGTLRVGTARGAIGIIARLPAASRASPKHPAG